MKNETYSQYTSRWHKVGIDSIHASKIYDMTKWCERYESNGKYYILMESFMDTYYTYQPDRREIRALVSKPREFRFENATDSMMFAMLWL